MASSAVPVESSVSENADSVTEYLHLVHKMRGEKNCQPLLLQPQQTFPYAAPGLRVQTSGKFVQKHHLRLRNQSQDNKKPLFLPAGQFLDKRMLLISKGKLLQQHFPVCRLLIETGGFLAQLPHFHLFRVMCLLELYSYLFKQLLSVFPRV